MFLQIDFTCILEHPTSMKLLSSLAFNLDTFCNTHVNFWQMRCQQKIGFRKINISHFFELQLPFPYENHLYSSENKEKFWVERGCI